MKTKKIRTVAHVNIAIVLKVFYVEKKSKHLQRKDIRKEVETRQTHPDTQAH